jgi:hypothetical protein
MSVETLLTGTVAVTLRELTDRIGVCLGKLTTEQIWARGTENENAIGNLVLHLAGNVRQWIISGVGGVPDIRERDREFRTTGGIPVEALNEQLRSTMAEAIGIVSGLSGEQLLRTYQTQSRTATGVEVLLKVMEHFGQHTGQIIYATKNLTGQDLGLVGPRTRA